MEVCDELYVDHSVAGFAEVGQVPVFVAVAGAHHHTRRAGLRQQLRAVVADRRAHVRTHLTRRKRTAFDAQRLVDRTASVQFSSVQFSFTQSHRNTPARHATPHTRQAPNQNRERLHPQLQLKQDD